MPLTSAPAAARRTPVRSFITRAWALSLIPGLCLALAACGGGDSDDGPAAVNASPLAESATAAAAVAETQSSPRESALAVATTNTLSVGITVPGFPHKVDVYRPAGATRAVVFLHGHGGRNWLSAYDLGINKMQAPATAKNVNWDWLSRNGLMAVFPQGQMKPGTATPTWSNHVTDSGQDDVAFLGALSSFVKAQYGATQVSLGGHSSGGVMTSRIWCEATPFYRSFVSFAGPMASSAYPLPAPTCTPLAPAPYFVVIGGKDSMLPNFVLGGPPPTPEQVAAGLTSTSLVAEWMRHQDRSSRVCGESPALGSSSVASVGPTWNSCSSRVRYFVVANADHPISSLDANAGVKMVDLMAAFIR